MTAGAILLASLLALTVQAAAAQALHLTLLPEAAVPAGPVPLGALAIVRGSDLAAVRAAVDLPALAAPSPGATVGIGRGRLAMLLQRAGIGQPAWDGAAGVQVTGASQRVAGDLLAREARQAAQDWLHLRGERASAVLANVPRDLLVAPGTLHIAARPLGEPGLRRRLAVWLDVQVGGQLARSVLVPFAVEVAGAAGTAGTGHDAVALPATAPDVRRGHWAVLREGAGPVQVEARVEVLQDGRVGDPVLARHAGVPSAFRVRVAAPGVLEVAP